MSLKYSNTVTVEILIEWMTLALLYRNSTVHTDGTYMAVSHYMI